MTNKHRWICLSEALNYQEEDAFVSDMALSSTWGEDDPPPLEALRCLWKAAHRNVRAIAKDGGISMRALAERFGVPYRTVEDWAAGKRTPPAYVLLMMQELLGLL